MRKVDLAAGGEKIYEIQHGDYRTEYQVGSWKKLNKSCTIQKQDVVTPDYRGSQAFYI